MRKLSRPWHGVVDKRDPDITVMKVYSPQDGQIQVHQSRVVPCPHEFPAGFYWYGSRRSGPGRTPKWVDKLLYGAIAPTGPESEDEQTNKLRAEWHQEEESVADQTELVGSTSELDHDVEEVNQEEPTPDFDRDVGSGDLAQGSTGTPVTGNLQDTLVAGRASTSVLDRHPISTRGRPYD